MGSGSAPGSDPGQALRASRNGVGAVCNFGSEIWRQAVSETASSAYGFGAGAAWASAATCMRMILSGFETAPFDAGSPFLI
jgi:hypothetical protein